MIEHSNKEYAVMSEEESCNEVEKKKKKNGERDKVQLRCEYWPVHWFTSDSDLAHNNAVVLHIGCKQDEQSGYWLHIRVFHSSVAHADKGDPRSHERGLPLPHSSLQNFTFHLRTH